MDGKFGTFTALEEDVYAKDQGTNQSARFVQASQEVIAQKKERPPRPSFGSDMEMRPRFAR